MRQLHLDGIWDEVNKDLCQKYPNLKKAKLIYVEGKERRLIRRISGIIHRSPEKVEEELVQISVQKLVV